MAQKVKRREDNTRTGREDRSVSPRRSKGIGGLRELPPRVLDRLALVGALVVAALFTGINIFHYPNYELDEGTYMGSAWAMFERGQLAYYTYTYDHPLVGWFQLGLFSKLVGGFLAFGSSINTGRVLMLLAAVLSTLLVFRIVRHASGRTAAALLSAVVFAVSPLGVGLHRQVWLDNLMTLWLLVSLYALVAARGRLGRIVVSGLAFGAAFWTKEIAVVFLPGMLYLAYALPHPAHRRFAFALWSTVSAAALSVFAMLALLKGEFFPAGTLLGGKQEHVSLIETFGFQANRGGNGSVFNPESDFRTFFAQWVAQDTLLMLGGLAAAAAGLLFFRRDKTFLGVSLMTLFFMFLLVRGGVVLHFYVIPLLALLAIALGLLAGHAVGALSRIESGGRSFGREAALALLALTVLLGVGAVPANRVNFTGDSTTAQNEATRWVANNLPNESVILMDAYPWADLRSEALVGDEPFDNAHYPLTALRDPEVRSEDLRDAGSIDYLLHSPSGDNEEFSWIDGGIAGRRLPLVDAARENSDTIKTFSSENLDMELRRARNLHRIPAPDNPMLANAWESYEDHFIEDGRVVDPTQDRLTTSEGQAYAMLRAVYMQDRAAFDEVWGWTKENLRVREDSLLAWKYGQGNGEAGVTDRGTATDADTDAALALLFAAKKFDAPEYEREALKMLDDVWEQETTVVGSDLTGYKRVVVAGDWAQGDGTGTVYRPVVNPSYLSPYAYKIFAEADPGHPWDDLVDSSYEVLADIQSSPELGGETGVVPNWVALDPASGDPFPAELGGLPTNEFSYDATRVPWRISLDYLWFKDSRALDALENLGLPRRQIEDEGRLAASYDLSGNPTADYEATSAYAGVLPGLLVGGDPATAHRVFAEEILGSYKQGPEGAYWGKNPDDYYNQNMAWFATAVMDGSMGNLYAGEKVIDWDETKIDPSLADGSG